MTAFLFFNPGRHLRYHTSLTVDLPEHDPRVLDRQLDFRVFKTLPFKVQNYYAEEAGEDEDEQHSYLNKIPPKKVRDIFYAIVEPKLKEYGLISISISEFSRAIKATLHKTDIPEHGFDMEKCADQYTITIDTPAFTESHEDTYVYTVSRRSVVDVWDR